MSDYSDLKESAKNLLLSNIKTGYSKGLKKHFFYISPDRKHYHQWFWDSSFHSIVMANFYPEYAMKEIETLLSVQQANGFIPHIIFWNLRLRDRLHPWWRKEVNEKVNRYITCEIQPPVLGISLLKIYERTKNIEFIENNISKVEHFYRYLSRERDPDEDNLVSIITPMESGMDMSPQFDIPFGNKSNNPGITKNHITELLKNYKKWNWNLDKIFQSSIFNVEDVAFNSIYCLGLEALSKLYQCIDRKKSKDIKEWSDRVKESILVKFWNKKNKIFFSIFHKNKEEYTIPIKTISSLFPIILDIPEKYTNSLLEHLTSKKEFWTEYPIPSVSIDESSFGPLIDTRFIWRGTTWINTNWFIAEGLLRHKRYEMYKKIREKTLSLVLKSGFNEFYDPFTGDSGWAMRNFGWSTLSVELI